MPFTRKPAHRSSTKGSEARTATKTGSWSISRRIGRGPFTAGSLVRWMRI
jgi:hypothetical protein